MQKIKKILSRRYPAILWTLIIFILLALPGTMLPSEGNFKIPNFDKYVHISIFCLFVLLWSIYYGTKPHTKNRHIFFVIFIAACLYGTAMEFVQKYFIPFRDFDLYDILADVVGACIGYLLMRLTINWWKRTE
ncbi:MAG: VanZ family protein [Bacteroidota bacterium]|nr:VanZ family protein [Bacteroidota bacterium]MDP4211599.1 VanZ family protein [Bacteroidota bacterium]MDP4249094.1 VanZ family protein [Bacteroidota bacterium]